MILILKFFKRFKTRQVKHGLGPLSPIVLSSKEESGGCLGRKPTFFSQKVLSAIVFGGILVFAFQNCGKAGFDTTDDATLASRDGKTSIQEGAPFAFKMELDTVAYNSCSGSWLAGRAGFFGFRGGAFFSGGVQIRKEFMEYAKASLKPSYPSDHVTEVQYKELLAKSTFNKNAQIQMSLRQLSNVKSVDSIYRASTAPTLGSDYFNVLGPLTEDSWMTDLIRVALGEGGSSKFVSYFTLGQRGSRNFEFNHTWNSSEGQVQSVRDEFRKDALLALTIQDAEALDGTARGPSSSEVKMAYGVGYKLNFGVELVPYALTCGALSFDGAKQEHFCSNIPYTNPVPDALNPDSIMTAVQEIDLESGKVVLGNTQWTCDETLRLMVVRPSDQAAFCPRGEDRINLDSGAFGDIPAYYSDLEKVRRVLPADQWDVNLTRRCVVPRDTDCYSSEKKGAKLVQVQYDPTKTCFRPTEGIAYTAVPTEICAHYVSICTKQ